MNARELKGLLKFLEGGVSDDRARTVLLRAHVSDDRKTLTCSDGHHLRRVTLAQPLDAEGKGNGLDAAQSLKRIAAGLPVQLEPLEGFPEVAHVIPTRAAPPTHDKHGVQQPQEKTQTEPCHGMNPALLGSVLSDTSALLTALGCKGHGAHISIPEDALSPWRIDAHVRDVCSVVCVVMPMRV